MTARLKQSRLAACVVCSVIVCWGLSVGLAYLDHEGDWRWVEFSLWLLSCVIPLAAAVITRPPDRRLGLSTAAMLAIALTAFGTRFYVLADYPFMAINDEIRHGALIGQQIAVGRVTEIFGFEDSQGLSSATICALFYRIFGPSLLTHRVPSAILSVLAIVLLARVAAKHFTPRVGVLAAVALICLPLDLHFARTLPLIESGLLWAIVLFASVLAIRDSQALLDIALCGIAAGMGISLHASVYSLCYLAMIAALGIAISGPFQAVGRLRRAIAAIACLTSGFVVGLGPYLLHLNTSILFGVHRLGTGSGEGIGSAAGPFEILAKLWPAVASRYFASLGVYFDRPFIMFFEGERFLTTPLFVLLVIGVLRALWTRSFSAIACVAVLLVVPLTNSAATELLNSGHRFLVAAPFVCILIALGVDGVASAAARLAKLKAAAILTAALFVAYGGTILWQYFRSGRDTEDVTLPHVQVYYLIRHASEALLASGRPAGPVICFSVCEAADGNGCEIYDTVHVRQFLEYYFPTAELEIRHAAEVQSVQELRVSRSCGEDEEGPAVTKTFCEQPQQFRCPVGLPPLQLHVARALL